MLCDQPAHLPVRSDSSTDASGPCCTWATRPDFCRLSTRRADTASTVVVVCVRLLVSSLRTDLSDCDRTKRPGGQKRAVNAPRLGSREPCDVKGGDCPDLPDGLQHAALGEEVGDAVAVHVRERQQAGLGAAAVGQLRPATARAARAWQAGPDWARAEQRGQRGAHGGGVPEADARGGVGAERGLAPAHLRAGDQRVCQGAWAWPRAVPTACARARAAPNAGGSSPSPRSWRLPRRRCCTWPVPRHVRAAIGAPAQRCWAASQGL